MDANGPAWMATIVRELLFVGAGVALGRLLFRSAPDPFSRRQHHARVEHLRRFLSGLDPADPAHHALADGGVLLALGSTPVAVEHARVTGRNGLDAVYDWLERCFPDDGAAAFAGPPEKEEPALAVRDASSEGERA